MILSAGSFEENSTENRFSIPGLLSAAPDSSHQDSVAAHGPFRSSPTHRPTRISDSGLMLFGHRALGAELLVPCGTKPVLDSEELPSPKIPSTFKARGTALVCRRMS